MKLFLTLKWFPYTGNSNEKFLKINKSINVLTVIIGIKLLYLHFKIIPYMSQVDFDENAVVKFVFAIQKHVFFVYYSEISFKTIFKFLLF